MTLTASNGTLSLNGTVGLTFTLGSGAGDASMAFAGTLADINAALNGLTFTPTFGFTGTAGVQLAVNDQANGGAGGILVDVDGVGGQDVERLNLGQREGRG